MLIYEVNLDVEEEVKLGFAGWLPEHIQKMLDFKGFKAAYWFFRKPEDEHQPITKTLWTIQYVVEDRGSLDDYLNNHAEGMRQAAIDKFGQNFSVSRRILQLLSVAGLPLEEPQTS